MPTIPYTKQTWTDDSSLCNAARNNVHENGLYELSYAPAVHAYNSATQSIPDSTITSLLLNAERFDQAGNVADTMHDNVTNNNRLTCRYAGIYQVSGAVQWAANATGQRTVWIAKQTAGTYYGGEQRPGVATIQLLQSVSALVDLAVNDYVELRCFQTSTAALLTSIANTSWGAMLSMVRVG